MFFHCNIFIVNHSRGLGREVSKQTWGGDIASWGNLSFLIIIFHLHDSEQEGIWGCFLVKCVLLLLQFLPRLDAVLHLYLNMFCILRPVIHFPYLTK